MEKSGFLWVGNWAAIDFVNTAIVDGGRPVDLLQDEAALRAWLREAGLPASECALPGYPAALERAQGYRALLRRSLEAVAAGLPPPNPALEQTNQLLAEHATVLQLEERNGAFQLASKPAPLFPSSFLAPLALSFAKLLTEADPRRLRKCRNPACMLWFYDTSKSGTRAWCSLDMCGNKMRMAASRRKRAG